MSRPRASQVGAFVRHQAAELTRIWRVARHAERGEAVFPGLLDGIVETFVAEAGALLESDGAPEDAFLRASGPIRWPASIAPAELSTEWQIVGEVLQTACESVNADPATSRWIAAAIAAADASSRAADGGQGPVPEGVVLVRVLSSVAPVEKR